MVESLSRSVGQEYLSSSRENLESLEEALSEAQTKYRKIKGIKFEPAGKISNENLSEFTEGVIREVNGLLGQAGMANDFQTTLSWLPEAAIKGTRYGSMVGLLSLIGSSSAAVGLFAAGAGDKETLMDSGLLTTAAGAIGTAITSVVLDIQAPYKVSSYNLQKTIILGGKDRHIATQTFSHEYTHHLQKNSWGYTGLVDNRWLAEGHARGVQKHVSQSIAYKSGNQGYEFFTSKVVLAELRAAYKTVCKAWGLSPSTNLVKNERDERFFDPRVALSHKQYGIGLAAISIAETKQGTSIYEEVLMGDFSFLQR